MKAIWVEAPGGPEVLKLAEGPRPEPGAGEALVRLHTAGINFIDVYHRRGQAAPPKGLPGILGREGAGEVVALGPGAEHVRVGDRVAFAAVQGAYAAYIAVPTTKLIPLPPAVDWITGGAAPLQAMTAHYLIHTLHETRPGETVLIHAAAGGVGQLAIQMAKRAGARVIGTVSTAAKAELARAAGADEIINYAEQDFAEEARRLTGGRGVDVVLDSVGKATFPGSLRATRDRGQVIIFGSSSGPADPIGPNSLQNPSKTVSGGSLDYFTATREELLERSGAVFGWLAEGALRLRLERVLPLAEAAEAHRLLEGRHTTGKIVLTID